MPPPCRLRRDAGVGPGSQGAQGETGTAAGARGGARSWGARKAEAPRWSRMRRMMRPSVMNATTRITPWQRGHAFLLKGDVFTDDVIETWIDYKMANEVSAMRLR